MKAQGIGHVRLRRHQLMPPFLQPNKNTIKLEPNNPPQNPPRPTTPIIIRKFRHTHLHRSSYKPPPFRETYYFFYGTLTDPSTLARVLNDPAGQKPQTRPAYIGGHPLKMYGEYLAVLNKIVQQTILDVAYMAKSREEATRLAEYERRVYWKKGCRMNLEDGSGGLGVMFVWNADPSLLSEGSFDLAWLERKNWKVGKQRG